MAWGTPSRYSLYAFYRVLCVRHFVSSWGRSPGASEQRTGGLVSDARTHQYAGRSIVPRLLLQHRDIARHGGAIVPCFEKPFQDYNDS